MKERPILFNDEMVRAILEGRKTQTRRIAAVSHFGKDPLSPDRFVELLNGKQALLNSQPEHSNHISHFCPHGRIGDRLWVREAWQNVAAMNVVHVFDDYTVYRATDPDWSAYEGWKWRPSIHMPRAVSRITLEITEVRIECLQSITEEEAISEGIEKGMFPDQTKARFINLWDSIYEGKGDWGVNPWVWVIEFRQLEGRSA